MIHKLFLFRKNTLGKLIPNWQFVTDKIFDELQDADKEYLADIIKDSSMRSVPRKNRKRIRRIIERTCDLKLDRNLNLIK